MFEMSLDNLFFASRKFVIFQSTKIFRLDFGSLVPLLMIPID